MVANFADALHAAVYKPATQLITQCSRSENWKIRRATYVLICHIADGCKKQVEANLPWITTMMLNGLNDGRGVGRD